MNLYENHYTKLNFERAGLFRAIREKYPCREVLYPGCSVHITPSLYFPHVVYVDQSDDAAQFFAEEASLLEFVTRKKHYRPSAYIRFIQQDYSQPLPLREGSFDLLLSLFASGIARSCARYLKPGGLLLTNTDQNEAMDAADNTGIRLMATIQFQKGAYSISEHIKGAQIPRKKLNHNYLKQVNDSVEFIENELYYLFAYSH